MLRLFTDFQAVDADGYCWILRRDTADPLEAINDPTLARGERVILDAHEDFEVVGTLDFRFVDVLGRQVWVARPDWSTRSEKHAELEAAPGIAAR